MIKVSIYVQCEDTGKQISDPRSVHLMRVPGTLSYELPGALDFTIMTESNRAIVIIENDSGFGLSQISGLHSHLFRVINKGSDDGEGDDG